MDDGVGAATVTATIELAERRVGGDAPCFIVAEIGANHDGDPARAAELVEMAAKAGADAVKFQTYTAAELVADPERTVTWGRPGHQRQETIGGLFDRLTLPRPAHPELFELARAQGMIPFSTPFSVAGVRFLDDLGVELFKVASSDVRDRSLLDAMGDTGKPVILSTGKSTLTEIVRAVERLRSHQAPLAVLHCVATYPAAIEDANLRTIPAFASMFPDAVIGFSDHTQGITAAVGAVALGARIVERHVTYDQGADGPDHWFSSGPDEFGALCRGIRELEAALGGVRTGVLTDEESERRVSVRSLVTEQPIAAGQAIVARDLTAKRPGTGIDPFDIDRVIGLAPTADLPAGTVLTWDHLRAP